jgi:hypothetical protein
MKLSIAFIVAALVFVSWDQLAHNGKHRREMQRMAGYMATSFHLR